ncbi:MAG: hypothetical protein ACOY3P_00030 [Planctomycetota bacterium]
MATTYDEPQLQLSPSIASTLSALRGRIRSYIWIEGVATALCWLGAAFWLSLAIDWIFEPSPTVRGLLLGGVLLAFVLILVRMVLGRLLVPLPDRSMATVLERRFPALDDSLLTTVFLSGRSLAPDEVNPDMLAHTLGEASRRIGQVRLSDVFDSRPLRRAVLGALLLAAGIAALGALYPETMGVWTRRNLFLSHELWPRKTHLEIPGFENGVVKVARGADYTLVVLADTRWPRVPEVVEIRYRTQSGARGRVAMDREGAADPAKQQYQRYVYTFRGVLSPVRFDVIGGDDRRRGLRLEVVASPTLTETNLVCRFPKYMERAERVLPVTGVMQVPLGSSIVLKAQANKPLEQVEVSRLREEQSVAAEVIAASEMAPDRLSFDLPLGTLASDMTILLTLSDTDGIRSRDPYRLALGATVDEPPQLAIRMDGIGTAITPEARIPLIGQVTDDNGIARLWTEAVVDAQPPMERPLMEMDRHPSVFDLPDTAVEVREWGLTPGQKLQLAARAADLYDLEEGKGPNEGTSERWQLEVVTPEQLRSMLEARELVLRQRFEVIVGEMTETRDLLLKLEFPGDGTSGGPADAAATGGGGGAPVAEPGDEPQELERELSPEQRLALHTMRVQRALQNSEKNAHEVLGVAESFDDIRKQLVNNRIDTEELQLRIGEGIAKPLHAIGEEMFPVLTQRCAQLQENLADTRLGPVHRDRARQQADDILAMMNSVLARMIELEDFNEAVELLRQIIRAQKDLDEATRQRHKQAIRELMED